MRNYVNLRKAAPNIVLAVMSICATFLLCEIGFRTLLFSKAPFMQRFRVPSLYADTLSDDDYWKLYYLFDGKFAPPAQPHPLLGWVGEFSRETYEHHDTPLIDGRRPVLLYGDSFAACAAVARPCFQQILNGDREFAQEYYFLNYGVGGYGVDQIYLLFKNSIGLYKNPLVVMSLMTEDLDRSIMAVRVGQKPYFEVAGERLVLRGTPIKPEPQSFFAEHPPEITSYLYRFVTHSDIVPWRVRQYLNGEDGKRKKKLLVNKLILLNIIEELRARNLEFIFLIFHPRERPVFDDWRDEFLQELLTANEVPFLSARAIVKEDARRNNRQPGEYYISGDGHPTVEQNILIANQLKSRVLDLAISKSRNATNVLSQQMQ